MKRFMLVTLIFILGASFVYASEDNSEKARQFLKQIENKDLIAPKISEMTPEELRDYIQTSHDFLRYSKGLRLEEARSATRQMQSISALSSQEDWDALYYEINFNINFTTEIISGYVQVHAASLIDNLTFIDLDFLDNMTVDSVQMSGVDVSYTHASDKINIDLDNSYNTTEEFSVYVYYNGHPTESGFQAFEFATHNGTDMATTLSEPYFARSWWPCKDRPDDKADSVDIIITHPDNFVCASNGVVESITDNGDGSKTTHWKHRYPITTYLVAIGVTNYTKFTEWYKYTETDSMPVDFYVYPEKLSNAQTYFPVTVEMLEVCSELFGQYPFIEEKYGMLHFDWGGAMEHQTNTSMASSAYYESIIVHELGHQWYGDMITCANWHEIWMNEGFATYTEALWFENQEGTSYYHSYMNGMRYTYGGTIYCQDTTSVWGIFSSRVYDKGAWVLHMLRHFVGDETFFDILEEYYNDPRYKWGDVTTVEFRDLCVDISGDTRLNEFFQDWFWGEYYPRYYYSWMYESDGGNDYTVYLHVRQSQSTPPSVFDMPIDITVYDGSNYHTQVVYNDQREQDFVLEFTDLNSSPVDLDLDRNDWILKSSYTESYRVNLISTDLSTASQYSQYEDSILVKGGLLPYSFSMPTGSLPDGLSLNSETGKITGMPTEYGTFEFSIHVEDDRYPPWSDNENYVLEVSEAELTAGDANFDNEVDISDAVYLINYVFVPGSPDPQPEYETGDCDCNGQVDISDAVVIVNYVFVAGSPEPGDC